LTLVKIALLVEKIGTAFIFGSQTEPNSFFSAKRPAGYYAVAGLVFRNPGCHQRTLMKSRFWQRPATLDISPEQQKVLKRLPGGGRNTRYQIAFGD